jgi:hypothetical protein
MTDAGAADELAGYRPVSGLAVAALLAGCGSALVLFTSLAAMLPLVAIVLAVVALVDLARSEGRRVGRPAALAGLALAIGFAAQATGGFVVDRWVGGQRAAATAAAWSDAVREGRFADAVGLCSPLALPPTDRDPSQPAPTEADRAAAFQALPAVAAVTACGRAARPTVSVRKDATEATVWIASVELAPCDRPGAVVTLRVEPRAATRGRESVERWLVTGFELANR